MTITKTLIWQFLRPIIVFVILYIIYFFSCFLSGYGANNNSFGKEINLFVYFVIAHLIVNFLYFMKDRKVGVKFLLLTTLEVLIIWSLTAWNIGYFNL